MVEKMDQESENIKLDILKMCWYMRGGITYNEAMNMSFSERNIVSNIIKENLETTKKTGLNFF